MDSSPPPKTQIPPKQMSLPGLLRRLAVSLGLMLLLFWVTTREPQQQALPKELVEAGKALQANNVDAARQQFEKYIARSPDVPDAYINVMQQCGAFNRGVLACWYGERAILACQYAPNPARVKLYIMLSSSYAQAKEAWPQSRAAEYARRALELDPNNANALNSLGYTLADNARTEPEINIALGYINQALALLRSQADGSQFLQQSQVRELQLLLAGTEDSYGWALYRRGSFHAQDYALAADALQQAINDLPEGLTGADQKVFYFHLGAASRSAGRIDEARHALQVALMYDPHYAEALAESNLLPASAIGDKVVPAPPAPKPATSDKPVFTPLKADGSPKKL